MNIKSSLKWEPRKHTHTHNQSIKRKQTFSALFFRAGSMSRDASSSATTNRSYLRHKKLFSASLTKAWVDRKMQCHWQLEIFLKQNVYCKVKQWSFGLSDTSISKPFLLFFHGNIMTPQAKYYLMCQNAH